MQLKTLLILTLAASTALAQSAPTGWSPPPMVPAGPPPAPAPEPVPAAMVPPPTPAPAIPSTVGTPPPPSSVPPYMPGQAPTGYQYSPYSNGTAKEAPAPEVGLMVSESLFGMLTAAGVCVLPYFLLSSSGLLSNDTIGSILLLVVFSAVPLAVAQTQISIANGSRNYFSETWPAALAGLAAEAGVLGIFYATGWLGGSQASGGVPRAGGSVPLLLIGTSVLVPLVQMAVINLTKQSKVRSFAMEYSPKTGLTAGIAMPSPTLAPTREGLAVGLSYPLFRGVF